MELALIRHCPKCQTASIILYLSIYFFVTACTIFYCSLGSDNRVVELSLRFIISSIVPFDWLNRCERSKAQGRLEGPESSVIFDGHSVAGVVGACMIIYKILVRS